MICTKGVSKGLQARVALSRVRQSKTATGRVKLLPDDMREGCWQWLANEFALDKARFSLNECYSANMKGLKDLQI